MLTGLVHPKKMNIGLVLVYLYLLGINNGEVNYHGEAFFQRGDHLNEEGIASAVGLP